MCKQIVLVRGADAWLDVATNQRPVPGDIFYAEYILQEPYRGWLSAKYWALPEPRRLPIVVVLPSGVWFCVDDRPSPGELGDAGWEVSGTIPRITVRPSINAVGSWHGWLTDGVLA